MACTYSLGKSFIAVFRILPVVGASSPVIFIAGDKDDVGVIEVTVDDVDELSKVGTRGNVALSRAKA